MFSMSSLTDIIFLLLIFFMVTSTLINPTAIDVSLPQSDVQTTLKPATEVYVDSLGGYSLVVNKRDSVNPAATVPVAVTEAQLSDRLLQIHAQDSTRTVAVYADQNVRYSYVVKVLTLTNRHGLSAVLATVPER